MWGGGRIGVRFLGGNGPAAGFIACSWEVPGMLSVFDLASMELHSLSMVYANYRMGDGRSFPRNPRSEGMLAKLVDDLHNANKDL